MANRLKLRLTRVIPSFRSCRSKHPSSLPHDPASSFLLLSQPHNRSSFKSHVSSAFNSAVGCEALTSNSSSDPTGSQPYFKWQKEEKWHTVAKVNDEPPRRKIYNSSVSRDSDDGVLAFPSPAPPPFTAVKKKRRSKKKKTTIRVRKSTSSTDSGWFSSEGGTGRDEREKEEETETLVSSSRSFSTDSSSENNPHLENICETPLTKHHKKKAKKSKPKRCVSKYDDGTASTVKVMCGSLISSPENGSPARLSMFKRLIPCRVDGKVKESFAVVKKSEDPYEDFKRSMVEMILEKQMFEREELEQLLQCFLSLNSRYHHGVIVEAFSEIWDSIFSGKNSSADHRRLSTTL